MIVEDPDFTGDAGRDGIAGGSLLGSTILFSWKLAGVEQDSDDNQKKSNFSDTQREKAARRNLLFFWQKSKFNINTETLNAKGLIFH